jgi:regulator of protease activity HflC (stomatin/prohibitin superfamily)
MAELKRWWFVGHLRSEASTHVLHHAAGHRVRSGRGLSFWFLPLTASISEVPVEDRDLPLLVSSRSRDHQEVTVQGVVSFRVTDAERLAERVDFTVDLATGKWRATPMEVVTQRLAELAQQVVNDWVSKVTVEEALRGGVEQLRDRVTAALVQDPAVGDLGLQLVSARIASVRPTAEVERALQTPTRERIQQSADRATFERRASAVELERAIAENELQNQIELAKREEELILTRGANERKRMTEDVASKQIEAAAGAERATLEATTQADGLRLVEAAKIEAETARVAIYKDLPAQVLWGLAVRELAGNLPPVEHLTLSPELVGPALTRIADQWGTQR